MHKVLKIGQPSISCDKKWQKQGKFMKRRQVIQGLLGVSAAAMTANWDAGSLLSARQAHFVDRGRSSFDLDLQLELSELDPLSDNERPTQLTTVSHGSNHANQSASKSLSKATTSDIDTRDADTMSTTTKAASPKIINTIVNTVVNKPNSVDKAADFARNYNDDVLVSEADAILLRSTFHRLKNLQKTIGYGHFNLVSFDESISFAKRFEAVGAFTHPELEFIERLFFTNAADYGFYGQKVTDQLTSQFNKSKIVKVPKSGHYIFKNESLAYYDKLKTDVGSSIILTSGIRSNVKQLYLFLAKTLRVEGNLSRASRSLAPPGYSYHGIGDFDVGRIGWGGKNFTDDFANTDEYKKMQDLGYIAIRYDHGNKLGVRFEPWHIKVV
jgi:ribosomal protein S20